jgi:anti-sigma factor RsiW
MNPECERIRPALSGYLDNELDPEATMGVKAHTASCRACADRLSVLNRLSAAFRGISPASVSSGFGAELNQKLAAAHYGNHRAFHVREYLLAASRRPALACGLFLALFLLVGRLPGPAPMPRKDFNFATTDILFK